VSLDFPAFGSALWSLYDRTGIRPEYVLPIFWLESGFNPGIVNSIGCTGIFQLCPLQNRPLPSGFASWSASQQLANYGIGMYAGIVQQFGPIGSATRMYQANFLPASLAYAKTLDSVLARQGNQTLIPHGGGLTEAQVYAANPSLDADHNGIITVGDLATLMRKELGAPAVHQAIASAYAQRPGESPVADPVLGTDFANGWSWGEKLLAAAAVATVVTAGVAYVQHQRLSGRPVFAFG
jgi:hypothetical protein